MSTHISVESIQGKQRRDFVKETQQRAKKEALLGVKEVLEAGLEEEVEDVLGTYRGITYSHAGVSTVFS